MINSIKLPDGQYFVEDTMSPDGYIALTICKSPQNIYETRVVNHGKQLGRPSKDMMPIKRRDSNASHPNSKPTKKRAILRFLIEIHTLTGCVFYAHLICSLNRLWSLAPMGI